MEDALGNLRTVAVTNMELMKQKAWETSNTIAGTTTDAFLDAAYDIKSGISTLSEEAVASMTQMASLTAKATKGSVNMMTSLYAVGHGIFKQLDKDMSDIKWAERFGAGVSKAVQLFRTTGEAMRGAIKNAAASASLLNFSMAEQLTILGKLQTHQGGGTRCLCI